MSHISTSTLTSSFSSFCLRLFPFYASAPKKRHLIFTPWELASGYLNVPLASPTASFLIFGQVRIYPTKMSIGRWICERSFPVPVVRQVLVTQRGGPRPPAHIPGGILTNAYPLQLLTHCTDPQIPFPTNYSFKLHGPLLRHEVLVDIKY